ncbi:MAG: hypothetical protein EBW21_04195 [Actinobacteria bacterium]|nr:hypothetical protein [Actinomycetota bacterium]
MLSAVLHIATGDSVDTLEILGSRERSISFFWLDSVLAVEVGVGVGLGAGAADLIATPEFQTSFEPFLMHV